MRKRDTNRLNSFEAHRTQIKKELIQRYILPKNKAEENISLILIGKAFPQDFLLSSQPTFDLKPIVFSGMASYLIRSDAVNTYLEEAKDYREEVNRAVVQMEITESSLKKIKNMTKET